MCLQSIHSNPAAGLNSASPCPQGKLMVGHGLKHDLSALKLAHPHRAIRDTSKYKPLRDAVEGGTPSLKKLALAVLGKTVQEGLHDPFQVCITPLCRRFPARHGAILSVSGTSLCHACCQAAVATAPAP